MEVPHYHVIEETHVMVVDNDNEFVTKVVDLLKSYGYKVMTVGTTSEAISMLFKGKKTIDVIMINFNSSNILSLDLLAKAVSLDIISLFVCDEYNEVVTKRALNEGAYIFLKNSFEVGIKKYLWQFVLRKKIEKQKMREVSEINSNQIMNVVDIGNNNVAGENEEQFGEKKNIYSTEEQKNNIHESKNDVGANKTNMLTIKRGRENKTQIDERERQSNDINKVIRRKVCRVWTDDLHAIFMKAMQQIGEEKCHPKGIHEEMNVCGITREQVSSHLQKYRRENQKTPKEQKSTCHLSGQVSSSSQQSSFQNFDTMPLLQENVSSWQCNSKQLQNTPEFSFSTLNTNNNFLGGESSIQQFYCPQLHAQPHYFNIDNSLNNTFLSTQNNVDGGMLQQQYGPLFGVLDSHGLQSQFIENTYYESNLSFCNWHHKSGNDYNLEHFVDHGATYSGSKIISSTNMENATINENNMNASAHNVTTYLDCEIIPDTYVENAIINEVEAANANFQQSISKQNMSDPSKIIMTSYTRDNEGSDSNEKEDCDAYFDFSNIDYLFQDLEPSSTHSPDELDSEFDQVYSEEQVSAISSN